MHSVRPTLGKKLGMKVKFSFIRAHLWLLGTLLCVGSIAAAETPPAEFGIRVGTPAPSFTLKDQNGKEVSLKGLLKNGPVALVFYRSADWCNFCKFELMHLQRNIKDFKAAGAQIVGISYDPIPVLKKFGDHQGITFPMLSDEAGKAIAAYGVFDDGPLSRPGCAAHVTLILDRTGVVRAKLLGVIYQEQPGISNLLKAIREVRNSQPKAKQG